MQLEMMVANDFPFKPIGLVHLANQIDIQFLPEQDARLTLETHFGEIYSHKRGWVIELITTTSVGSDLALTGKSYYLSRVKHKDSEQIRRSLVEPLPTWISRGFEAEHPLAEHHKVEEFSLSELMFRENIGRRYAKVSGDYNPIHLYPYTTKLLGFKKAIAHGMYSKAWALSLIAKRKPVFNRACSVKVLFLQPIILPLTTHLACTNQDLSESGLLHLDLFSKARNKKRSHLAGQIEY